MTTQRRCALALALCAFFSGAHAEEAAFNVSTDGGLKIASRDGNASLQLGGRLQYDYDATRSRDRGIDTRDFDMRRARLDVRGRVGDWGYKIQFNLAESDQQPGGGTAEDLYITYTGFGPKAQFTIGKQQEPLGLERVTSDNDNLSLERSAVSELYTPNRTSGIKLHGAGEQWTYALGVFEARGDGVDDFGRRAVTGRVTYAPYRAGDTVLHLGASATRRQGDAVGPDIDTAIAEAALSRGPLFAQAEYFTSDRNGRDLDGYYVQLGWVLTGETHPYQDGVFGRIKPDGKRGALELALRHEAGDGNYADIGLDASRQIFDGRQTTLGVNWYADRNARVGLSYMRGEAHDASGLRLRGDELRLRFQYAF